MFGAKKNDRNNSNQSSMKESNGYSLNSLVTGTQVNGTIKASSDIRIDGSLEGDLECSSKLIIGQSGVVQGEVKCQNALIEGSFDGTLVVQEMLQIKSTANVKGSITYNQLEVEAGASVNGSCHMHNPGSPNHNKKTKLVSESQKVS